VTGPKQSIRELSDRAAYIAPGPSKVMSLEEAIRSVVRPRMHLHLTSGTTRPVAALYEIFRQFRGTDAAFTLSAMALTGPPLLLVEARLVKTIICGFQGEGYPTPSPSPILQRAWRANELEIKFWSNLSYCQRLLAGALGIPFIPVPSLADSSIASDNDEIVRYGGQLCASALVADVAIVHALAADEAGNTVFGGPFGDRALGAWSARNGVIVTVERIVPSSTLIEISTNWRLPAARVRAVVEVPFGAHPNPLFAGGLDHIVSPYSEDLEFSIDFRNASRNPDKLIEWTQRWVTSGDHDDYLCKLGAQRLAMLRGRACKESSYDDAISRPSNIADRAEPSDVEIAVLSGANAVVDLVRSGGHKTVLSGVGISNLAAWMARARLASGGTRVDLMVELGLYGYVPPIGDPLLLTNRNASTALGLGDMFDVLGASLLHTKSAGVLGAAEVDRGANLNSTLASNGELLVGAGGATDVASFADDVIVVTLQSRHRFVEEVRYRTCSRARIRAVVTQYGIFEKDESDELVLTAVNGPPDTAVGEARANCSWDLKVARSLRQLPDPDPDDIELLRAYDPQRYYLD
jgi:acyl CoA:acetate/3-ketoacid CoA transferase alpha subunit